MSFATPINFYTASVVNICVYNGLKKFRCITIVARTTGGDFGVEHASPDPHARGQTRVPHQRVIGADEVPVGVVGSEDSLPRRQAQTTAGGDIALSPRLVHLDAARSVELVAQAGQPSDYTYACACMARRGGTFRTVTSTD